MYLQDDTLVYAKHLNKALQIWDRSRYWHIVLYSKSNYNCSLFCIYSLVCTVMSCVLVQNTVKVIG